jgi:hypothetical protein
MESLSPFLWDSFIPYSLSVYPGAYPGKRRYCYKWVRCLRRQNPGSYNLNLYTRMCRMLHIGEHNAYQSRN